MVFGPNTLGMPARWYVSLFLDNFSIPRLKSEIPEISRNIISPHGGISRPWGKTLRGVIDNVVFMDKTFRNMDSYFCTKNGKII
jgi:hypothetical protein